MMDQTDYRALADFRLEIRRFMDFSRQFLEAEGLPPVQYQAMLAIKARDGAEFSIGDLAAELFVRVQTAVELVGRMQAAGLIERRPCQADRRRILLRLTGHGERILPGLAGQHHADLKRRLPAFEAALARFEATG